MSTAAAGPDAVYGLLGIGDLDVALPLSALREVVPYPSRPAALPVSAAGLVGAIRLRSLVLPVVDLRLVLGDLGPVGAERVVVVVAHGGRLVGLVVDEVCGVTRVGHDSLLTVGASDSRLLMSHAFQDGPDATLVSVLDAEVLLSLPGVPTAAEPVTAPAPAGSDGDAGSRRTAAVTWLTVARAGSQRLALDVGHVHTTIPLSSVRPSLLTGGDCLGTVAYAGNEVPVLDPLSLLGLDALPSDDLGAGLVVDLGTGLVVLAVSELVRLVDAGDRVRSIPAHAAHRGDLVQGILELEDGPCLVLDGQAIKTDTQLTAFAMLNTAVDPTTAGGSVERTPTRSGSAAPGAGPAYVTYTAGVELATALDQVSEILPVPTTLTPTAAPDVLGLMVHRGHAVPVCSLARVLGREPAERSPSSCLLLVECDGGQVAFAVDALGGISPLAWSDPEAPARTASPEPGRLLLDSPLVQVADGNHLFRDLDLRGLARVLRAPVDAADGVVVDLHPVVDPGETPTDVVEVA